MSVTGGPRTPSAGRVRPGPAAGAVARGPAPARCRVPGCPGGRAGTGPRHGGRPVPGGVTRVLTRRRARRRVAAGRRADRHGFPLPDGDAAVVGYPRAASGRHPQRPVLRVRHALPQRGGGDRGKRAAAARHGKGRHPSPGGRRRLGRRDGQHRARVPGRAAVAVTARSAQRAVRQGRGAERRHRLPRRSR